MGELISVCMSTFNRETGVLDRVLNSICSKNESSNFEVIVVDDGSSENEAKEVCNEYPVQYVKIDREPIRRNPCVARNMAYKLARGNIIVPQSDDVMHITYDSLRILSEELEPGIFVIANVFGCSPQGSPWSEYAGPKRQVPYFFLGSLYRSDLYAVGGNDEDFAEIPGCEDKWFACCLINGLDLKPKYITSVIGHHQYHKCRTDEDIRKKGTTLLKNKMDLAEVTGVWCSSGGPWCE